MSDSTAYMIARLLGAALIQSSKWIARGMNPQYVTAPNATDGAFELQQIENQLR